MQMYLERVSTRKVRDVTEALCGTSFSKSTVSNLVKTLDADLAAWRDRSQDSLSLCQVLLACRRASSAKLSGEGCGVP
jgi:transposase-like protein